MVTGLQVKSVAVIGAGASGNADKHTTTRTSRLSLSGTAAAAALKAEGCFDKIKVFERREAPGGLWYFERVAPRRFIDRHSEL